MFAVLHKFEMPAKSPPERSAAMKLPAQSNLSSSWKQGIVTILVFGGILLQINEYIANRSLRLKEYGGEIIDFFQMATGPRSTPFAGGV